VVQVPLDRGKGEMLQGLPVLVWRLASIRKPRRSSEQVRCPGLRSTHSCYASWRWKSP